MAQQAALNNPEVRMRWHAFAEAGEEVGRRRGFFPRIDATAGKGKEKLDQPCAGINDRRLHAQDTPQPQPDALFDGLLTYNEVKQGAGRARLVRYFEFLDASENVALEAARAYIDVVRYRYRVYLAEQNYIEHRIVYEQGQRCAESGVGRRVDVEQAGSRLALADVN